MKKRHVLIATGLGLGFCPIAPGSIGALGGLVIAQILSHCLFYHDIVLALLIILFFFLGVYSSTKLETDWGKDPSRIVIDEVVGMWISMLMIPSAWEYTITAFILFRFFDILKPLFIKKIENLKGGWGIMMDDVIAGIYTNLAIQALGLLIIKLYG